MNIFSKKKGHRNKRLHFWGGFSNVEKSFFIENLSLLVSSGMDISSALNSIKSEARSKRVIKAVDFLIKELETGVSLHKGLEKMNFLGKHTISFIKIGEESGKLAENLKVLSLKEQKEKVFRSKIYSAMMYPLIVLLITFVVGIGVAWFILPRLASMFASLDVELPIFTKVLISTGTFLSESGHIAVPLVVLILVLLFYLTFFFKYTKFIGEFFLLRSPGLKDVIREIELSRFGYVFGTMLESGVNVMDIFDSLRISTGFRRYAKIYKLMGNSIEEGNSFKKTFNKHKKISKVLPYSVQQMIVHGEQSSSLGEMFLKIGNIYETKTENTTKNFSAILEPVLLVIVWLGVVFVALAVILPIYSMLGGVRNPQSSSSTQQESPEGRNSSEEMIVNEDVEEKDLLGTIIVTATEEENLDVFDEPTLNGEVVGQVAFSDRYEYEKYEDGWYSILLENGTEAWIFEKSVQVEKVEDEEI